MSKMWLFIKMEGGVNMSDKTIVSFSFPKKVKEMLNKLAERTYSTKTKYVVDMIRKDYKYWFDKEKEENNNVK